MREIEFRGLTYDCEWEYGNVSLYDDDKIASIRTAYEVIEVKYETVGQFINYYDMNKRKIFEGDVVEYEDHGMCDTVLNANTYRRGKVVFDECRFCFVNDNDQWADPYEGEIYNIEVIGNVHQNPKLLNEV